MIYMQKKLRFSWPDFYYKVSMCRIAILISHNIGMKKLSIKTKRSGTSRCLQWQVIHSPNCFEQIWNQDANIHVIKKQKNKNTQRKHCGLLGLLLKFCHKFYGLAHAGWFLGVFKIYIDFSSPFLYFRALFCSLEKSFQPNTRWEC